MSLLNNRNYWKVIEFISFFEIKIPSLLWLQGRVGAIGREKAKMLEELEAAELAVAADQVGAF